MFVMQVSESSKCVGNTYTQFPSTGMLIMQVSEYSKSVGNMYTQFPSTGVLIVWKWEPLKYNDSKDELGQKK